MAIDEGDVETLFAMSESDLLRRIGATALREGLGAVEPTEDESIKEGMRIVKRLKPLDPEGGLCAHPLVAAFIHNPSIELLTDIVGVVGDVGFHMVLSVPPVTLTVAFIRFGLKQYCAARPR